MQACFRKLILRCPQFILCCPPFILCFLALLLGLGSVPGYGQESQRSASVVLRDRFVAVSRRAVDNPFREPIYLRSSQSSDRLQGEIYAMVSHPFEELRRGLGTAGQWCDILILHLNVKYCRATDLAGGAVLDVALGRKFDEPLADAYWARFLFRNAVNGEDYVSLGLQAETGPLGTRDYRIEVEAAPQDARRSVVHLTNSFA
jgi:hypothetical protein